ncbi:sensor histidine kinase [Pelagibacterium sediminicola]|uniref:sensor histidine kinase n=1 Tax=Pelagibacterium sediminicola TaxID=2248761 RepID=UPI000E30BC3A|nr:PAS domain-containing sensor histidine kinase [Pelagibacterium sediminicola]
MSRFVRALLGIALPVLTILIFVLLLAFSLMRLSDIEKDMRIEATQNMLWVISRAHIASLQLSAAAAEQAAGALDEELMKLRYDVFLSRMALLDDGPQRRRMEELGFAHALDALRSSLPELSGLMTDLTPENLPRIQAILFPYNRALGQAGNKAMVAEWDGLGNTLDTSREQLWQIIVSLIGISLAGAALCGHFLWAIRDARRRTRLLDKEKAFSELLIGSSGEGIVAVDNQRRCTVWNEAAERLFDQPANNTLGRALADISGFFEVGVIGKAVAAALEGRSASLLDQPFFAPKRAGPLYVDLRCFSLRDGARIIGAILLISDVTERREAQKEIADHRDHLEQLVEARTRELDAALTRERATAELYRNFGTMISHQFRTPLAIVDSALQRLMRRRDRLTPDEILERGGNARQAIARLTGLVESTLDAARLDAGQIEIRSKPCDLATIIADICARQAEQTPGRAISVDIAEGGSTLAYCDPIHAENILTNLVTNAIKYSPEDTEVSITLAATGDDVECVVANKGVLQNEEEREALFERYFRGSNAEGRPGIGVGLYMARALARLQGGDVRLLHSVSGTVQFALLLPCAARHPGALKTALLEQEPA